MTKAILILLFLFSNFLSCPTRHGGQCHVTGDVDGDGIGFTANDYNDFVDYLAGIELEYFQEYQVDFNADCVIDNRDFEIFECHYNHGKDCSIDKAVTACCEATHCCQGIRGDINGNGDLDIGDIIFLSRILNRNNLEPNCFLATDINLDNSIDTLDLNYLMDIYFKGANPTNCFEE